MTEEKFTSTLELRHPGGKGEILMAAAHAFAEHGYHGMSMRHLAKATGRAPATLYNYFRSKEDLLYTIQRDAFDELVSTAESSLSGIQPAPERLAAFVENHVRFFASHPDVMRVLVHEASTLPPQRRSAVRALKERYFAIARDIVGQMGSTSDEAALERASYCLFGMLNWIWGWYDPARHGPAEDVARTIASAALGGLVRALD